MSDQEPAAAKPQDAALKPQPKSDPFTPPPAHDPDIPEKFRGKGLKEVVEIYKNLESAYGKSQQEKKLLSDAVEMVKGLVYFDDSDKTLKLHDDNIKMYSIGKLGLVDAANAQGKGATDNGAPPAFGNQASDNTGDWDANPKAMMDQYLTSDQFKSAVQSAVNPLLQEAYKNSVAPWVEEMKEDKAKVWVKDIKRDFPEFEQHKEKISEMVNNKKLPINTYDDFRDAVLLYLAKSGELIDKKKYDVEVKELQDTISVINPSALAKPMTVEDEMNAPLDQLFGVAAPENTERAKTNQILFGTPYRPDD